MQLLVPRPGFTLFDAAPGVWVRTFAFREPVALNDALPRWGTNRLRS
jgi:hypothetical protein